MSKKPVLLKGSIYKCFNCKCDLLKAVIDVKVGEKLSRNNLITLIKDTEMDSESFVTCGKCKEIQPMSSFTKPASWDIPIPTTCRRIS